MKNTAKKYILTLFVSAVSFYGCSLKEEPGGIISPTNFYKTEADFNAAIVGAIQPLFSGYGAFDFNNALLLSGGAEDVTSRPTAANLKQYDEFKEDVNGFQAFKLWTLIYQSINSSNLIIANMGNADAIVEATKNDLEGQARYIRAMGYFFLTRWFGEIPLILTPDDQLNASTIGQSKVADVYAQIITDLTKAEDMLVSSTEKGRPTKGAAKALLAEVYLNMTGWPLKDASKYALARDKAKEVMDMGTYSLEANFADLWKVSNKLTNNEFIFMFNGVSGKSWINGSHLHVASRPGEEGGWDDMMSEARFFYAFPDGARKDATFHTVFTDASHTTWENSLIGQPYMAKYRDAGAAATADGPVSSNDGDGFFVISRFSEVLLIYAEAANMAEGSPSTAALDALNKVRTRAGASTFPTGMSQQAFGDSVIAERSWEFAFELKRWFDLVRTEKVVEVNQALYPNVSAKNMLIPKPQVEVDKIKGLVQNTGY